MPSSAPPVQREQSRVETDRPRQAVMPGSTILVRPGYGLRCGALVRQPLETPAETDRPVAAAAADRIGHRPTGQPDADHEAWRVRPVVAAAGRTGCRTGCGHGGRLPEQSASTSGSVDDPAGRRQHPASAPLIRRRRCRPARTGPAAHQGRRPAGAGREDNGPSPAREGRHAPGREPTSPRRESSGWRRRRYCRCA